MKPFLFAVLLFKGYPFLPRSSTRQWRNAFQKESVHERVPFSEERGKNEKQTLQKERGRNEMAIFEERKNERIRSFSRSFPHKRN